jgi:hypothetical protein
MAQLVTAFADLLVRRENTIHGPDRAEIDALIEQAGIDLGGGLIGKARRAQQVEYGLAFRHCQAARWAWL